MDALVIESGVVFHVYACLRLDRIASRYGRAERVRSLFILNMATVRRINSARSGPAQGERTQQPCASPTMTRGLPMSWVTGA
jgi:hypothetical protein